MEVDVDERTTAGGLVLALGVLLRRSDRRNDRRDNLRGGGAS